MFRFSLSQTWISFSCSKREIQSLLMAAGSLLRQNEPPHNKVIHAQGSAVQVGCVKHVDAYGSFKSCEIEHTSEFYDALINCVSCPIQHLRTILCHPNFFAIWVPNKPWEFWGSSKALGLLPRKEGTDPEERFGRNLENLPSSMGTMQNHIQMCFYWQINFSHF